jgi:hypothetical protein
MMLGMMMGCRLLRRGALARAWGWGRVRCENAGLSDKAEDCSQKQNVFCHNVFRFSVEVGLLITFSAEAWPTTALFRAYRPTTARSGEANAISAASRRPKAEASSNFSYSSHSPQFAEHLEEREVSKKIAF